MMRPNCSTTTRESIMQLLHERNERETLPFIAIHQSNATLLNMVDILQHKCDSGERETALLRQQLQDASLGGISGGGMSSTNAAVTAAIRSEARLRDKLEKLQEEYNAKLKAESEDKAQALKMAKDMAELKDLNVSHEQAVEKMKKEQLKSERAIEHLQSQVEDAQSRRDLAEKQYEGLKQTIRILQEENDALKKENRELEKRLVSDKTKTIEEMNVLTEMVEALKKEVDMLRTYNRHEEKRSKAGPSAGWFGLASSSKSQLKDDSKTDGTRKFGSLGVVLPTFPKHIISAHSMEGVSVRYDRSGSTDFVATASSDGTVKIWDTKSGTARSTLRGSTMMCCDLYGNLVVGASSDKTCRVWNLRTDRMIHQLVGHQQKVTCVRFCGNESNILTASADRSMKVWDISRQTYRQNTTLRHGSTCFSVDVASDCNTVVSGHMDGGLRFWDLRTGGRTAEIACLHEGSITSVQFHPTDRNWVLTNSIDSCLQIIDLRTSSAIHRIYHAEFSTSQTHSKSVFSPDGNYVAAGSNSSGTVFVWRVSDGSLEKKLTQQHEAAVCTVDWSRGGSSGQQVASIDRKGTLILWA